MLGYSVIGKPSDSQVTMVRDKGKIYLGLGAKKDLPKCLGRRINSYNNFFTKTISRMVTYTINVEINGKKSCLSKKSLKKHLRSIGVQDSLMSTALTDIKKIGYDGFIKNEMDIIKTKNITLGDSLSDSKRNKLFKQLIASINNGQTSTAKKLIQQGALLDKEFYYTSNANIVRLQKKDMLNYFDWNGGTVNGFDRQTPLTFAIDKNNYGVANFIYKAKKRRVKNDYKESFSCGVTNGRTRATSLGMKKARKSDGDFKLK